MKDPAFLFYSGDFLSGTMLMNNEEKGIYITLLCLQHQNGHMRKEDMQGFGATEKIFNKFKLDENNLYYNERLDNEINKRKAYSDSRRKNREKNNISKTYDKDMNNICETYVEHMENENININKNIIKKKIEDCKGKEKKPEKIHFAEFVTMTNAEHDKLVSTLGKELTDQCIEKLDNYKGSSGKKYTSDYRAILSWVIDEVKKKLPKQPSQSKEDSWDIFMREMREKGET